MTRVADRLILECLTQTATAVRVNNKLARFPEAAQVLSTRASYEIEATHRPDQRASRGRIRERCEARGRRHPLELTRGRGSARPLKRTQTEHVSHAAPLRARQLGHTYWDRLRHGQCDGPGDGRAVRVTGVPLPSRQPGPRRAQSRCWSGPGGDSSAMRRSQHGAVMVCDFIYTRGVSTRLHHAA